MNYQDKAKKAAKYGVPAAVGLGLGAAGTSVADDNQSDEVQNLKEKVNKLQESKQNLESQVAEVEGERDTLRQQLDERPTQEVVDNLEATVKQKNQRIDNLFTQEEVDELVADATEREGLVDYVPVVVDEDVELDSNSAEVDGDVDEDAMEDHLDDDTESEFDLEDEEGEEFDELRVDYLHDEDDHDYRVLVRSFEDGEDADAYHEAVEDAVEDADYEEDPGEDAYVYRNGDTVVYIHGEAGDGDYGTYDFEALRTQY